ncbi:hypothetical protein BSPA111_42720 [Buttiauxella sp. A111]|nr:hypothetical protein BSPA111_42720 [Buttiauxella sp. A111]
MLRLNGGANFEQKKSPIISGKDTNTKKTITRNWSINLPDYDRAQKLNLYSTIPKNSEGNVYWRPYVSHCSEFLLPIFNVSDKSEKNLKKCIRVV